MKTQIYFLCLSIMTIICCQSKNNKEVTGPVEILYGAVKGRIEIECNLGKIYPDVPEDTYFQFEVGIYPVGNYMISVKHHFHGGDPGSGKCYADWKVGNEKESNSFSGIPPGVVVVRIILNYRNIDNRLMEITKELRLIGNVPIEVRSGQVTDLGTITFENPPDF